MHVLKIAMIVFKMCSINLFGILILSLQVYFNSKISQIQIQIHIYSTSNTK